MAAEIPTGRSVTEEWEGRAQVGELDALLFAAAAEVPAQCAPALVRLTRVPRSGYASGNPVSGN